LCDGSRPVAGLLGAKRSHLLKIGGYNSKLERWGWEDDDVQVRLRRTALLQQVESGVVLHLSHGDDRRALYGQSRDHADMRNFSLCCEQYADANFMGTYLQDVEVWKDRVVESFECPPDSPQPAP